MSGAVPPPPCMPSGYGLSVVPFFELWNVYFTCTTEISPSESEFTAGNDHYGFNADYAVRVSGSVHAVLTGCLVPSSRKDDFRTIRRVFVCCQVPILLHPPPSPVNSQAITPNISTNINTGLLRWTATRDKK